MQDEKAVPDQLNTTIRGRLCECGCGVPIGKWAYWVGGWWRLKCAQRVVFPKPTKHTIGTWRCG